MWKIDFKSKGYIERVFTEHFVVNCNTVRCFNGETLTQQFSVGDLLGINQVEEDM